MRAALFLAAALSLAACSPSQPMPIEVPDGTGPGTLDVTHPGPLLPPLQDAGTDGAVIRTCQWTGRGCELPEGEYVPLEDGPGELVWQPSGGRYTNEPTLVREASGTWHVIANSATGIGNPWEESQLVHATAPSLRGPWTEHPDALSSRDTGATEFRLWAPFAMADRGAWLILYWAQNLQGREELHAARSPDLFAWTREAEPWPGGRDAMLLRLPDGRDLLYSVGTVQEPDGIHDVVRLFERRAEGPWQERDPALRNPDVCTNACWGFYESPYVLEMGGHYYLFTTFTDSGPATYERTAVFRSRDPLHFDQPAITVLQAHGGEFHVENERLYMTRGGWPNYIGEARRGVSIVPIAFRRVE